MTLALLGGEPVVSVPHPHNVLNGFTDEDRRAIIEFLHRADSRATYEGRSALVKQFEDELAAYHGRNHCILVNSGTSALHSAYFGMCLGPGDEVVAPTCTYFATVTSMLSVGAVPVLADCEVESGNLDAADAARRITDRTRAIVVTHQWGHVAEMDEIVDVARRHNLLVLEDSSVSFGARHHGRSAGTFGDTAAFSLGASKLIAGGQGGALLTDAAEVAQRATLLGHPGQRSEQEVTSPFYRPFTTTGYGHNYRMHPVAVAMSYARFRRVEELIARRHDRLNMLSKLLEGQHVVTPPVTPPHIQRGQWGGYVATYHPERAEGISIDLFTRALTAEGLEVSPRGYHPLLHRTAFFRSAKDGYRGEHAAVADKPTYREGDLPQAEAHADTRIGFPTFLDEPESLIRGYADAVHKVVEHLGELATMNAREAGMSQVRAAPGTRR